VRRPHLAMSQLTTNYSSADISDFLSLTQSFRLSKMLTKMNSAVLHTIRASLATEIDSESENLPSMWITLGTMYTINERIQLNSHGWLYGKAVFIGKGMNCCQMLAD
jgi:hypothetical protein